jgi:DNA-directed RNA polymerase subunit RPC12/RpoP
MAWFKYQCSTCAKVFRLRLDKREPAVNCADPVCSGSCKPLLGAASTSQVVEVLDNGIMPRKVERLHNIEEIMEERAAKYAPPSEGEDE